MRRISQLFIIRRRDSGIVGIEISLATAVKRNKRNTVVDLNAKVLGKKKKD